MQQKLKDFSSKVAAITTRTAVIITSSKDMTRINLLLFVKRLYILHSV